MQWQVIATIYLQAIYVFRLDLRHQYDSVRLWLTDMMTPEHPFDEEDQDMVESSFKGILLHILFPKVKTTLCWFWSLRVIC